jgi:hypothetical protein
MHVCVCVCERVSEREREREDVCISVFLSVYLSVCALVKVMLHFFVTSLVDVLEFYGIKSLQIDALCSYLKASYTSLRPHTLVLKTCSAVSLSHIQRYLSQYQTAQTKYTGAELPE